MGSSLDETTENYQRRRNRLHTDLRDAPDSYGDGYHNSARQGFTNRYMPDDTRSDLNRAIEAFNEQTNQNYSTDTYLDDLSNGLRITKPSESSTDISPTELHADETARKFLEWSDNPAKLVYKHDTIDPDGTVHRQGDKFKKQKQ